MTHNDDLINVDSHFEFGRNWVSYVDVVTAQHVENAVASLSKLLSPVEIAGKRFIDIGCGSGMSMLASLASIVDTKHKGRDSHGIP